MARPVRSTSVGLAAALLASSCGEAPSGALPQGDGVVSAPSAAAVPVDALVGEVELDGVTISIFARADDLARDEALASLALGGAGPQAIPSVVALRSFEAELAAGHALSAPLRIEVAWPSALAPADAPLSVLAWDHVRRAWVRPLIAERAAGWLGFDVTTLSTWVLAEPVAAQQFEQIAGVALADGASLEARGDAPLDGAELKAESYPNFVVRSPLATPLAAGHTMCMEYRLGTGALQHVVVPFGSNKWITAAVLVDDGTPVWVRFYTSALADCSVEDRSIFPDDARAGRLRATWIADTLADTCTTDTGTICGRYYLAGTVVNKRSFQNTGTLACPGSPSFPPDGDGDRIPDACEGFVDECPANPDKTTPGVCGCDVADADADGDLIADCIDPCPGSAINDDEPSTGARPDFDCNNSAELGGAPFGISASLICGPTIDCPAGSWGADFEAAVGPSCETQFLGCGNAFEFYGPGDICSGTSECASGYDEQPCVAQTGTGDGFCGDGDNCPTAFNPWQEDADGDGVGDACDDEWSE